MTEKIITADDIRGAFVYDANTGLMYRLFRTSSRAPAGIVGSRTPNGYLTVRFKSTRFLVHRLVWLYVTGEWPNDMIDHVNGDPSDNRWSNLRDVPSRTNNENMHTSQKRTLSGLLGVHIQRTRKSVRYLAQIGVEGRLKHIGSFDTPEQAYTAYLEAKRKLHKGCTI